MELLLKNNQDNHNDNIIFSLRTQHHYIASMPDITGWMGTIDIKDLMAQRKAQWPDAGNMLLEMTAREKEIAHTQD